MNKGELITHISESGHMTRAAAKRALDSVLGTMTNAMKKGEKVTISGFGSFRVIDRAPQLGRNPQTGKPMTIPARKVVKFKPAKKLTEKVD